MIDFKKLLMEAISNFHPVLIRNEIKNIEELNIGGKIYKVKDGELIIGEGKSSKIQLIKDSEGFVRLKADNTELEGISGNKDENIKMLDEEEKVFTRSDLGEVQLEYLSIDEKHEEVIRRLRPVLSFHKGGKDLGALLVASTIIKLENKKENKELIKEYLTKLHASYLGRGGRIYNLFRSEILEDEILPHLEELEKISSNLETFKFNFLIYWDAIIEKGYPTAYFVTILDKYTSVFKELKWRLERGSKYINIYSRTKKRNRETEKWCERFAEQENCNLKKGEIYHLGFTPARKFRIAKKLIIEDS